MTPAIAALLRKSLDGLSLRYAATAQNIANANSDHYRPMTVSFENELRTAAAGGAGSIERLAIGPRQAETAVKGSSVRMDLELQTASETAMRYGALVDVLGRELQLERTIIRGGQ